MKKRIVPQKTPKSFFCIFLNLYFKFHREPHCIIYRRVAIFLKHYCVLFEFTPQLVQIKRDNLLTHLKKIYNALVVRDYRI